jgi:hypothetical protein
MILTTRQGREGWLRDARQRLDQRRAEQAGPIPRSRPERLREGKRRLEEELASSVTPTRNTRPTERVGA